MKILHVIGSVDPRSGGPVAGVIASSQVWQAHGHERHIVSLDPPDAPWVRDAPVPTFAVGIKAAWYVSLREKVRWLRYGYTPELTAWLQKYARNYDAVVLNGLWNYASLGSWRALRGGKVPYFIFTHGMLDPWFNKADPIKTCFKTLYWKLFEHRVLRDARGVLFTCEEERQLASTSFHPYKAREFVVGYGTQDVRGDPDAQRETFYALVPGARGKKIILFLSRIHPKKGIDLLIEAFSRHAAAFPEFDLVIAGPDQSKSQPALQALAGELNIAERIHWPGMLVGDAKWGAFLASDLFVLPSHQENFGIVVSEALASGTPVLITNKVNIWREIEADGAGIVTDDTVAGIEAGLLLFLDFSADEIRERKLAARSSFVTRFDLESNAMQLLDLIETELSKPRN